MLKFPDLLNAGEAVEAVEPPRGNDCEDPGLWLGAGDSVLLIVIFFSIRFSLILKPGSAIFFHFQTKGAQRM